MASLTDEAFATNYLRYWWEATPFVPTPTGKLASFPDAIAYYRGKSPSFLSQLGSTVRGIRQDKVKAAFEALAKKRGAAFPAIGEFYDSLASQVKKLDSQDVKDVAVDTAKDVAGAALFGLSGYLLILALGAAVIFLPTLLRSGRRGSA